MNPYDAFRDDVARPDVDDYAAWGASQSPTGGASCKGCGSVPGRRSPIERVGPHVEVPAEAIDEVAKILAYSSAVEASRELDVSTPEIRWFTDRHENKQRKAAGWFLHETPGTIWLRAGLPEDQIMPVTRHETKHYADFAQGRVSSEKSAEAFEERPRPFEQPCIIVRRPRGTVHVGGNY